MKILALDLGSHAGYAHNLTGELVAGTWHLATDNEVTQWGKRRETRRRDPRIQRFYSLLSSLDRPDIVAFEDVEFASSRKQAHLWASYRTTAWLAFGPSTLFECVPVGTLKKFAGCGNGDKKYMLDSLRKLHPKLWKPTYDDNAIDAIWIFLWAMKTFGRL